MTESPEKFGTEWQAGEIDAAVADYFLMLAEDRAMLPYSKAEHRRALMRLIGRTKGSVEYKHQNISAVLENLGVQWIPGYKPARNYQDDLVEAVERYLAAHPHAFEMAEPTQAAFVWDDGDVLVAPPPPLDEASADHSIAMRRLIAKFDPVERDRLNRELGHAGEEFVVGFERRRLERAGRTDLARQIRWVSQLDGDGAGYDILSFVPSGAERLLEVKTTFGGDRTPFWLTRRECDVAGERAESFRLCRVFQFGNGPRMFELTPPLEDRLSLSAVSYRASIR